MTADAHRAILQAGASDVEHMTGTRLAITKVNQAERLIAPFAKSLDEITSDVASTFSLVYQSLGRLLTQSLDAFKALVRLDARVQNQGTGHYAQELAEIGITVSKINAKIDGAWKLIAEVAALSTNALIDHERPDADGRYPYFRITSKERVDLRARLEGFFEKDVLQASGGGRHAVQVAPALIWQFLGQPGWKPA